LGVCDAIWRARIEGRSDRVHVFCLRAGASAGHVRRAEAYPRLRWPEAVSSAMSRRVRRIACDLRPCEGATILFPC
jgi:hypothetical protein